MDNERVTRSSLDACFIGPGGRLPLWEPKKTVTLTQCWFNVGPASATLAQHQTSIGLTSCVCLETYHKRPSRLKDYSASFTRTRPGAILTYISAFWLVEMAFSTNHRVEIYVKVSQDAWSLRKPLIRVIAHSTLEARSWFHSVDFRLRLCWNPL